MSVVLSGELTFTVRFTAHPFPVGVYTTGAIIHTCAQQNYARTPFNQDEKPEKMDNFKVTLVKKTFYKAE